MEALRLLTGAQVFELPLERLAGLVGRYRRVDCDNLDRAGLIGIETDGVVAEGWTGSSSTLISGGFAGSTDLYRERRVIIIYSAAIAVGFLKASGHSLIKYSKRACRQIADRVLRGRRFDSPNCSASFNSGSAWKNI
jgi:hypothetical protein